MEKHRFEEEVDLTTPDFQDKYAAYAQAKLDCMIQAANPSRPSRMIGVAHSYCKFEQEEFRDVKNIHDLMQMTYFLNNGNMDELNLDHEI